MHALITMDYINEITHENGKFAAKGYPAFIAEHSTFDRVNQALKEARARKWLIVHVRVGFEPSYACHPVSSPLFGKAAEFGALKLGTWATEFNDALDTKPDEPIVLKQRVSPFYGTRLEPLLRVHQVQQVYLAGVATDLVVQAAARDAHDRDMAVTVLADCCAAGSQGDHETSLVTLGKIARVVNLAQSELS